MDTACKFATSVEAFHLSTISIVDGGVDTDFETAHGVVQYGGHDSGVVSVRHGEVAAREELVEEGLAMSRERIDGRTFLPNGSVPGFLAYLL